MVTIEAPPKPATPTERAVAAMLVENTGAHFLDSGMYGRAWQRTRAAFGLDSGMPNSSFHGGPTHQPDEPEQDEIEQVALAMRDGPSGHIDSFGTIYVDTFHWLVDRVDYEPALDRKFRRYVDKLWMASRVDEHGNYDRYGPLHPRIEWPYETGAIDRFIKQLRAHGAHVEILHSDNSYNHEENIDRTIQYTIFSVYNSYQIEEPVDGGRWYHKAIGSHMVRAEAGFAKPEFLPDGNYVALQIHGGADVRGGYTDARLFTVPYEWGDLLDYERIEVWCDGADLVPDAQAPGQITMEAEVLEPEHVIHYWDNSYGDSHLRRYDRWQGDQVDEVLGLPYREEDREELANGVKEGYGIGPRTLKVNLATYDDEAQVWRCPFDGSPLHVSGATVG